MVDILNLQDIRVSNIRMARKSKADCMDGVYDILLQFALPEREVQDKFTIRRKWLNSVAAIDVYNAKNETGVKTHVFAIRGSSPYVQKQVRLERAPCTSSTA